jgi:hypothetical protein
VRFFTSSTSPYRLRVTESAIYSEKTTSDQHIVFGLAQVDDQAAKARPPPLAATVHPLAPAERGGAEGPHRHRASVARIEIPDIERRAGNRKPRERVVESSSTISACATSIRKAVGSINSRSPRPIDTIVFGVAGTQTTKYRDYPSACLLAGSQRSRKLRQERRVEHDQGYRRNPGNPTSRARDYRKLPYVSA